MRQIALANHAVVHAHLISFATCQLSSFAEALHAFVSPRVDTIEHIMRRVTRRHHISGATKSESRTNECNAAERLADLVHIQATQRGVTDMR
jgi:hypothetical protein